MNSTPSSLAPLIGRILIASFFIPSGIQKITGFAGTVGYATAAGLPLPEFGVVIAIITEILAAGMLLVGFKARWAALALAVFSLVAAFFFHNYWASPADQQMAQHINFYKNCAIAGGLLFIFAFGPGRFSLDARSNPASARI